MAMNQKYLFVLINIHSYYSRKNYLLKIIIKKHKFIPDFALGLAIGIRLKALGFLRRALIRVLTTLMRKSVNFLDCFFGKKILLEN